MHWTVTGISGCGKSRVMKEFIIPAHRRAGRWVGVLDPLESRWPADWSTSDPAAFVAAAKASRGCVWVVDEYAQFTQDYAIMRQLEWLFTVARNRGHLSYALAQRVKQIPPNVRNQCSNAIVFNQQGADLADLAAMMNQPAILDASAFPPGRCLVVKPFENPVPVTVFAKSRETMPSRKPAPASAAVGCHQQPLPPKDRIP